MKNTIKKEDLIRVLKTMLATPKFDDELFRKKNGLFEAKRQKKGK